MDEKLDQTCIYDLFDDFKSDKEFILALNKAYSYDRILVIKILKYLKNDYPYFIKAVVWIIKNHTEIDDDDEPFRLYNFSFENLLQIAECHRNLNNKIAPIFATYITRLCENQTYENEKLHYMPTEKSHYNKTTNIVEHIAQMLYNNIKTSNEEFIPEIMDIVFAIKQSNNSSKRVEYYRKIINILKKIHKNLKTMIETKKYSDIDYETYSYKEIAIYKKLLLEKDNDRFSIYLKKLYNNWLKEFELPVYSNKDIYFPGNSSIRLPNYTFIVDYKSATQPIQKSIMLSVLALSNNFYIGDKHYKDGFKVSQIDELNAVEIKEDYSDLENIFFITCGKIKPKGVNVYWNIEKQKKTIPIKKGSQIIIDGFHQETMKKLFFINKSLDGFIDGMNIP